MTAHSNAPADTAYGPDALAVILACQADSDHGGHHDATEPEVSTASIDPDWRCARDEEAWKRQAWGGAA